MGAVAGYDIPKDETPEVEYLAGDEIHAEERYYERKYKDED